MKWVVLLLILWLLALNAQACTERKVEPVKQTVVVKTDKWGTTRTSDGVTCKTDKWGTTRCTK